ncbi:carbohydrate ABC transporter permease [Gracilinema caldarium]|jgi:multiple sugar transport system permease protein|uniref:ABC-type transporter, integral membrane subunit n=1 Tax=Gracilinema caldarium (strain ATCC 51460 / DSM 7334 / H1) TaxID=744872 RepID=F8F269_GRAC1|nr:sugar ABC transporter permease [Gracilinema caldarium]AEJ20341.1 ABC-type transporter, integral membrane subunit [Gracilinema caldarium DSM 7334]
MKGIKNVSSHTTREHIIALFFIFPSLIGFSMFFLVPTLRGFWLSFTNWDLLSKAEFIGFKNYKALITDPDFWHSLFITFQYVLWNIPIQTVLALLLAMIMERSTSSVLVRSLFLIPWLLPNVVVALLWLWMMDPAIGIINEIIKAVGFKSVPFLFSDTLSLPSVAAINIWRHMGYTALIVFAGIQGFPKEVEEAALIDGAGPWKRFFTILIPYLKPVLAFVVITSVIGSFQIYDTIAVTTKGGPVNATYVIYLYIFKNGFESYRMGYATAVSMVLFLILIGISFLQMRLSRANESDF